MSQLTSAVFVKLLRVVSTEVSKSTGRLFSPEPGADDDSAINKELCKNVITCPEWKSFWNIEELSAHFKRFPVSSGRYQKKTRNSFTDCLRTKAFESMHNRSTYFRVDLLTSYRSFKVSLSQLKYSFLLTHSSKVIYIFTWFNFIVQLPALVDFPILRTLRHTLFSGEYCWLKSVREANQLSNIYFTKCYFNSFNKKFLE